MKKQHLAAAALAVSAATGLAMGSSNGAVTHSAPHRTAAAQAKVADAFSFRMFRSSGAVAASCLNGAWAEATIVPKGPVEELTIDAHRLPPRKEFDLFVTQLPNAPFGMSWYQGDMESNRFGDAHGRFIGRFNIETFIVAPGVGVAPNVHSHGSFPDATQNVATAPVHTFHLGLWFGSPATAAAAGCPTTVTPFNGDHTAGIQALSTRQFADTRGPLRRVGS